MNGQVRDAVDIIAGQAARIAELEQQLAESRATVAAEELHELAVLRCEEWDESGDDLQAGNWYKFDDVGLSLFAADLLAAQQAQAAPVDDVEQITERIRQIYADQPDRTKTVMYRDVCHLLGHIALLRGATPAQPQVQDTPTGRKPLPTPEQLLAVARDTGLRSYLHGVNATEARELLYVYIDAVRLLDTNYLPEPQVQPAGDAKDAARYRWLRGQSDWFANPERFDYKMSEVDAAIDAAMQSAAGGAQ